MAVSIRMRRMGTNKVAFYHVVAADSKRARNGKFIEKLGYYDPRKDPPVFQVNAERIQHWLGKGARPSQTVAQLIAKYLPAGTAGTAGTPGTPVAEKQGEKRAGA